MAIEFRDLSLGPLRRFTAAAPDGAVIGVAGVNGSGQTELLQAAAGVVKVDAGDVSAGASRYYLSPTGALDLRPANLIAIDNTFATQDALARAHARVQLDRLRASGATVLIASHEADVILRICDEVWWLENGTLARRGDPNEIWTAYLQRVAEQFQAWGKAQQLGMEPSFQRGDGRAEVVSIETLGAEGRATMVWRSGEEVTVRVIIRYREAVDDPVVGVMIRTRVGFDVYGTNTELEQLKIGPCAAGQTVRLDFAFRCDLCNNEYTLTVASHDRDGTAHDWLEDAVAFVVADSRYTAGVANLRARVVVS
jgi:energy-coupling factor transporter ATP-binding protein EcfA2